MRPGERPVPVVNWANRRLAGCVVWSASAGAGGTPTLPVYDRGSNVRFTFGLPRGNDGTPGEVSNQQLNNAISGTSANSNSVATLDAPFTGDPPSLADLEVLRSKMNELIVALRR